MILPTKHLRVDRSLLYVGAEVLSLLSEPKTVSRLWDELKHLRTRAGSESPLGYDWFVLSLDLLYMLGIVAFDRGRIRRKNL